jgi:hypothetical protein
VATILKGRGIQFAFSTGDNEAGLLPASLADSLVFTKPYRIADVEQSLRRMVAQRGSERG